MQLTERATLGPRQSSCQPRPAPYPCFSHRKDKPEARGAPADRLHPRHPAPCGTRAKAPERPRRPRAVASAWRGGAPAGKAPACGLGGERPGVLSCRRHWAQTRCPRTHPDPKPGWTRPERTTWTIGDHRLHVRRRTCARRGDAAAAASRPLAAAPAHGDQGSGAPLRASETHGVLLRLARHCAHGVSAAIRGPHKGPQSVKLKGQGALSREMGTIRRNQVGSCIKPSGFPRCWGPCGGSKCPTKHVVCGTWRRDRKHGACTQPARPARTGRALPRGGRRAAVPAEGEGRATRTRPSSPEGTGGTALGGTFSVSIVTCKVGAGNQGQTAGQSKTF